MPYLLFTLLGISKPSVTLTSKKKIGLALSYSFLIYEFKDTYIERDLLKQTRRWHYQV